MKDGISFNWEMSGVIIIEVRGAEWRDWLVWCYRKLSCVVTFAGLFRPVQASSHGCASHPKSAPFPFLTRLAKFPTDGANPCVLILPDRKLLWTFLRPR